MLQLTTTVTSQMKELIAQPNHSKWNGDTSNGMVQSIAELFKFWRTWMSRIEPTTTSSSRSWTCIVKRSAHVAHLTKVLSIKKRRVIKLVLLQTIGMFLVLAVFVCSSTGLILAPMFWWWLTSIVIICVASSLMVCSSSSSSSNSSQIFWLYLTHCSNILTIDMELTN